jgi:pimeloyl-ACP methyl ester carboxylesterase
MLGHADLVRRMTRILPLELLLRDRYDNAAKVPRLTLPTLVVHGAKDDVVPWGMGERLYALMPNARFHQVPEAGHDDSRSVGVPWSTRSPPSHASTGQTGGAGRDRAKAQPSGCPRC